MSPDLGPPKRLADGPHLMEKGLGASTGGRADPGRRRMMVKQRVGL
jgi:hypothetical protein